MRLESNFLHINLSFNDFFISFLSHCIRNWEAVKNSTIQLGNWGGRKPLENIECQSKNRNFLSSFTISKGFRWRSSVFLIRNSWKWRENSETFVWFKKWEEIKTFKGVYNMWEWDGEIQRGKYLMQQRKATQQLVASWQNLIRKHWKTTKKYCDCSIFTVLFTFSFRL